MDSLIDFNVDAMTDPKILQALVEQECDENQLLESNHHESTFAERFQNSKVIAWTFNSINLNSIISPAIYLSLQIIDSACQIYLLVIVLYSQIQEQPLKYQGIIEEYLYSMDRVHMIIFNSVSIAIYASAIILLAYHTSKTANDLKSQDKQHYSKKAILVIFQLFETVLSTPLLVVVIRNFFADFDQAVGLELGSIILSLISLGFLTIHNLVLRRIYSLRLNNPKIPWAIPNSNIPQIYYIWKVAISVFHGAFSQKYGSIQSYSSLLIILLILINLSLILTRHRSQSEHQRVLQVTQNLSLSIQLAILTTLLIDTVNHKSLNSNVAYLIILTLSFFGACFTLETFFNSQVRTQLKSQQLEGLEHYLKATQLLEKKIDGIRSQRDCLFQEMSFVLGLIRSHNTQCIDANCFCAHIDSVLWIIKRAQASSSDNFIELYEDELELLNSYNYSKFYPSISTALDTPILTNQYIIKDRVEITFEKDDRETRYQGGSPTDVENIDLEFEDQPDSPIQKQNELMNSQFRRRSQRKHLNDKNFSDMNIVSNQTGKKFSPPESQSEDQMPILKIDIQKLIQSYLTEYINYLYKQALAKYPKSVILQLRYEYFLAFYMRNIFVAINQMRQFDPDTLSNIENLSYRVNEAYLISEFLKIISQKPLFENGYRHKKYGIIFEDANNAGGQYANGPIPDLMGRETLDHEHFININNLTQIFYSSVQQLNFDVLDFWKTLSNQDEEFDIPQINKDGETVSESIKTTQRYFVKITEAAKYADHKLYHIYALVQKLVLNDSQQYELYLNKMKSLITMQKLFKSNSMKFYADTDLGLILGSTSVGDFGKILLANQYILRLLGYAPNEFKHQKVGIIQPRLIRDNHEKFLNKFQSSGESNFMHQLSNQFILNKDGYVIMVQLYAAFHYSIQHTHTIIMFITPVQEMPLQKNGARYPISQLLFFICDSQGQINEISESCFNQLQFSNKYLTNNDLRVDSDKVRVQDLFPQVDFLRIKDYLNLRNDSDQKTNLYELIFEFNMGIITQLKTSQYTEFQRQRKGRALALISQERYGSGIVDQYVVIIKIIDDNVAGLEGNSIVHSSQILDNGEDDNGKSNSEFFKLDQEFQLSDDLHSASSSDSYTNFEQDMIKQSLSTLGKQTPRSLKVIIQLTLLIFLIMLVISGVNLYLLVERTSQLSLELRCYRDAAQRDSVNNRIRVIVRSISLMANGYERTTFSYIPTEKYQALNQRLFELTTELKILQQNLDQSQFEYSDLFRKYLDSKNVYLRTLNQDGTIGTSNQTLAFAMNLYTSRLLDYYNLNLTQHQGKLTSQTLKPNRSKSYQPSDPERIFYYINQNGLDSIRYTVQQVRDKFGQDILLHAQQSTSSTETAIIISICSILVVGLVVTPLLAMIFDRKYVALNFFVVLDPQSLDQLVVSCYQCLLQINSLISVKKHNQPKKMSNKQSKIQLDGYQTQSAEENSRSGDMDGISYSIIQPSIMEERKEDSSSVIHFEAEEFQGREQNLRGFVSFNSANTKKFGSLTHQNRYRIDVKAHQEQKRKETMQNVNRIDFFKKQSKLSSEKKSSFTNVIINVEESKLRTAQEMKESIITEKGLVSHITEQKLNTQDQNTKKLQSHGPHDHHHQEKDQKNMSFEERQENKRKIIKDSQFKLRIRIFLSSIVLVVIFSSYFLGSYFMSLRVFDAMQSTVDSLSLIYSRGTSSQSYVSYFKENLIRNLSYPLYEKPTTDALSAGLNSRQAVFVRYTNFRKKLPPNLVAIEDFINDLESNKNCNLTYNATNPLRQICNKAANGVLNQGFSNAYTYFGAIIQQDNIIFLSNKNRSESWLKSKLNDETILELTEVMEFLMVNMAQLFKDKATTSTMDFYDSLVRDYLIMFSCFIFILLIIISTFSFSSYHKIKQHMFRTNMILKILPLDKLNSEQIQQLKNFFK